MDWSTAVSQLEQRLRRYVDEAITRIFLVTQFASSSALGSQDAVETADEDNPDRQRGRRPVTRSEPFGLRSRPTSKVRGVTLKFGKSNALFLGILPTKAYGPQDLNDGELALYSAFCDAVLRANQDGSTAVGAASGEIVSVNGADFSLPKTETLLTALAGLSQVLTTVLGAATDTGIVGAMAATPAPPILNPTTGLPYPTNSAALAGLLASATPYKSTKAKNG